MTVIDELWGADRHEQWHALCSLLWKVKVPRAQAEAIQRTIFERHGDDPKDVRSGDRDRVTNDLYEEKYEKVGGWKKLARVFGFDEDAIKTLRSWLSHEKQAASTPIGINVLDLIQTKAAHTWAALERYRISDSPSVYNFGGTIAYVDDGKIQVLGHSRLKHEVNRAAQFYKPGEKGNRPCDAPNDVVEDLLATRPSQIPLPKLRQIVNVPIFAKDGRLVQNSGFDDASGIFLESSVEVPTVSQSPSREEVAAAVEALKYAICDFPFDHPSDRAHTLAAILQFFTRPMWSGPSPAYLLHKPTYGSGASLLVTVISTIAMGRPVASDTLSGSDEEQKKKLTAGYAAGQPMFNWDNVNEIEGESIAGALTTERYAGRILSESRNIDVENLATHFFTGNNPEMSDEMVRRMISIYIKPHEADPTTRKDFKEPRLAAYVKANRAKLVHACLTIIQSWIAAGMKPYSGKLRGSYEEWSTVLGGIMENAGIEGFLATPEDRDFSARGDSDWGAALAGHWGKMVRGDFEDKEDGLGETMSGEVTATELLNALRKTGFEIEWEAHDRRQNATSLARLVGKLREKIFEFETATKRVSVTIKSRKVGPRRLYMLHGEVARLEKVVQDIF